MPHSIKITIDRLYAMEIDDFESAAWQDELNKLSQQLWREKKPYPNEQIDLLEVLDVLGVKSCLRAFGAADPAGHRTARLIACDLADVALKGWAPTTTDAIDGRAYLDHIRATIERGQPIAVLQETGVRLKYLANLHTHKHSDNSYRSTLEAISSIVFPYDGPPDDLEPIGDLCALEVLDCVIAALAASDSRFQQAARIADIAIAAEKRWQEGTNLKFRFCSDDIERQMEDLEGEINKEKEPNILQAAVPIIARHLGRRL